MRFAALLGLLLLCAFFENLGDAGGYLAKTTRGQLLLAIGAMAVYGALAVAISKAGWSFTHAFPLYYFIVYKLVSWGFAVYIDGYRITRWDVAGGALMLAGAVVVTYGVLQARQY